MTTITPDDIEKLAGQAEATEKAAEAATETVESTAAGSEASEVVSTSQTAMEEFTHTLRAMREMREEIAQEQSGGGFGEAIAEVMKVVREDPEIIQAAKAYLYGPELAPEVVDIPQTPKPDGGQTTKQTELESGVKEMNQEPTEHEELDGETAYDIATFVLRDLSDRDPEMTVGEIYDTISPHAESNRNQSISEVLAQMERFKPIVVRSLDKHLSELDA